MEKASDIEIRYVVEQKCEKQPEHRGLLGAIPVSTNNPRRVEELLITGVVSCEQCTFHSKFYEGKGSIVLVAKKTKSENHRLLSWLIGGTLLLGLSATIYTAILLPSYLETKNFTIFLALLVGGINVFISVLERKASTHAKVANWLSFLLSFLALHIATKT